MSIKIAVVEQDSSFREAMSVLVESIGFTAVPFACLDDFISANENNTFASLVLSARRDGRDELEAILALVHRQPATRVVMLTDGSSTSMVVRAIRGGLSNLLEYPFNFSELTEAINEAVKEHANLIQALGKQIAPEICELLNPQEEDIATLMLEGASVKEIAAKLDVSVRTIHYRKNEIYRKIGAKTREQALKALKFKRVDARLPV